LSLINPGFIAILWTDPMGVKIAITALCMMIIGIFWMWRLVKIRV
jgi:tight adherence protein B